MNCPSTGRHRGEEYLADFYLIGKRTLTDLEFDVFRFHFLQSADWQLCTRRLGIGKGAFFHSVYRIEAKLGQAFAEARPYALYPVDEYFAKTTRVVDIRPFEPFAPRRGPGPVRPPLAQQQPVAHSLPAPAPIPCETSPGVVLDIGGLIRERFRAGSSLRAIAVELDRLAPRGAARWGTRQVRAVLLGKAA